MKWKWDHKKKKKKAKNSCGLTLAGSTPPHSHFLTPHSGMGKWIGRVKVQKLKNSFPMSRKLFSHLQESRSLTWEDKHHSSEHTFFLLHPTALYAEHVVIWSGNPFGGLGSAVSAASIPSFLCTSSLLIGGVIGGVVWETENTVILCKHCLEIVKTSTLFVYKSQI